MAQTEREFFESLPRSRGAATALLRDTSGGVVVVKPTYKPGWSLPGGVIEEGESPLAACRRECAEEIGFVPELTGLAGVDWLPPHTSPDRRPATIFVFAAWLRPGQFHRVRLPPEELSDVALVAGGDLAAYLPAAVARRISACLWAEGPIYLEHGYPVTWAAPTS